MIYKLTNPLIIGQQVTIIINLDNGSYIPVDPANTDYQNFILQINDETAQLETADGVLMTPEEAKAYVATLPPERTV